MAQSIEDQFNVLLSEKLIGRLHRRDDVTRFVFDENYWSDPNRLVLGLNFEENYRAKHQAHMRLPPWFSNLLPEGRLRQWVAEARQASIQREMELLAQVGHDLPGAIKVIKADDPIPVETLPGSEMNLQGLRELNSLWSFSLAGVGLKFSMLAKGDRLTIPAVGEGGDWIVKLPDSIHRCVPWNEFAMMTLAGKLGINVPEVRMVNRDAIEPLPDEVWMGTEEWAYAIKRFDRASDRQAVHMEDLAQVRGFYPERKYNGSFETVAALIYRGKETADLIEFTKRLVFNILIGNGDSHLKNWSLIYPDGRNPILSPAYDLVSTYLYRPIGQGPEELALKICGTRRFEKITAASFDILDRKLNATAGLSDVAQDFAKNMLNDVEQLPELFVECREIGVSVGEIIKNRVKQFV